jgi:hypothetical protein
MANEKHPARLKQGLGNVLASNSGWDHGSCLDDSRIPVLWGPGFLSRQAEWIRPLVSTKQGHPSRQSRASPCHYSLELNALQKGLCALSAYFTEL